MRNTRLVLIKAKRLMVRGISHFEADFTSLYQIVLGTNGSGKSYILSESSPLPASPKMFEKGGRKEYYCDHNGSKYELINDFETAGGRHSFIVDGVDLNENGTAAIQKELVKKHFKGLTQELFNVLTFRKFSRFSEMDTNKRRQWMMLLSGIDLDWAMEVYQALRTRARDASGHVKRINQKLAVEIQSVVDDSEIEEMEKKLKTMREDFSDALLMTKKGVPSLEDIDRLITPKINQIHSLEDNLTKYMQTLDTGLYTFGLTNSNGVDLYITSLSTSIEMLDVTLAKVYEDKERVDGELSKLKELGAEGLSEYKKVIDRLNTELELVDQALATGGFELTLTEQRVNAMNDNLGSLTKHTVDVLSSMFDNSAGLITIERTTEYRNREHDLLLNITDLQKKIEMLRHRMEHSKETAEVECPSCNFLFKPGFHGKFEVEAPKAMIRFETELADSQKELREVHEYLAKVQLYVTWLDRYRQLTDMFSGYETLWEKIGDYGVETNNPKNAISILNSYVDWVKLYKHRFEVDGSLKEKQTVYEQAMRIDAKDMESTRLKSAELDTLIDETINKIAELRNRRTGLRQLSHTLEKIENGILESEMLLGEIETILEQEDDALANKLLEDVLCALKSEMEALEQQVSTIRVQRAIVEDLRVTVEQAKFEQDMYKFFSDELSPTDGLIADVLRRFIKSFTENQTNIISSIWSYPLIVLPCISSKDGLDYKFPIRVFGSSLPIPDVSEGSDAQVDVIDFSFVVMVMSLLDLHDFPLFLDEPISRMDELHRIEMIRIIQSMVESNQCSQMFFISHFAAQHGSFPEAETMVMDSANIVNLPTIYNKHCVIK